MAQPRQLERAQLLPTKEALTALKSDVTLESAVLELCDNALDAWKRCNDRENEAVIHVSVEEQGSTTSLTIHDNTGGVPRAEAAMLFGLGRTAKHEGGSIGVFGVGAKKSLVNLGVPFTIKSHHPDDPEVWQYRITDEWFEDDEDWSVPIHNHSDILPGTTEIVIEDLNYEWDEQTAENLRSRLGKAYNLFLSDEIQTLRGTDYDLTIIVDGVPVEPEGLPDWSYSPFDGLYPRRYENIQLQFADLSAPVNVHLTVGLLRKKDTHTAGTDIYCQNRKIITSSRDEVGGFGEGPEQLGLFSARHERLKVLLEIETTADGQKLPWDTQKSSIDTHNLVMRGTSETRGVYNWVRRIVQAYYELDADKVPQAFLEPYDADSSVAANNGKVVTYDYSDRKRVVSSHRPDTDLPEVNALRERAEAHAYLLLRCDDAIDPEERPAYKVQLARESDRKIESLDRVDESPPPEVESDAYLEAGRINELARIHLENAVRYTADLDPWQIPRYKDYFDKHGAGQIPASDPSDYLPTSLSDIENKNSDANVEEDSEAAIEQSSQPVSEEQDQSETAELFLVFSDDDEERGALVFDLPKPELCKKLGLPPSAEEERIWNKFRQQIDESIN